MGLSPIFEKGLEKSIHDTGAKVNFFDDHSAITENHVLCKCQIGYFHQINKKPPM
jgi:hypothetical protein